MLSLRAVFSGAILFGALTLQTAAAQNPPSPNQPPGLPSTQSSTSDVPTLHVTSRLVFLDVTVLDSKGHPVTRGLTKDDFTITQDKKPQKIFSFEAPDAHIIGSYTADDNPSGKAPATIFVLDQLNSSSDQLAHIRDAVHNYLAQEPTELKFPAEVMVLGNESLEMVQGYTRDKQELLSAVDNFPAALPYKLNPPFLSERFTQSLYALQFIALGSSGIPGRKNIIWIGGGGPSVYAAQMNDINVARARLLAHKTVNLLVDARMSLFLIEGEGNRILTSAENELGSGDPFADDFNFGTFVNETGGRLFFRRNDLDQLIRTSIDLGSRYYTLTYQPPEGIANGEFRSVRVTMRNPALHVMTKAGYFAPDKEAPIDPRVSVLFNVSEATQASVPFAGLGLTVEKVVRHADTGTAEITVDLSTKNIGWHPWIEGKSTADIGFSGASLSRRRDLLASNIEDFSLINHSQNPDHLEKLHVNLTMSLRIPRHTKSVRLVVGSLVNGRIGSVDIDRKTVDAAPDLPTPQPKLVLRPHSDSLQ